jgi:polypeptide N-acetylgalactosaminyltransferase
MQLTFRLSEGQKEYIDKRGVHVVVGHYVGNSMDSLQVPNITKGMHNNNDSGNNNNNNNNNT